MPRTRGSSPRTTPTDRRLEQSDPILDFLIVADRAEVVNGKLYMMGGAWDRLYVRNFDEPVGFFIALGVLVPWNATNIDHQVDLRLHSEDGAPIGPEFGVSLNVGRPPQASRGQSFRAHVAAANSFTLPGAGAY